MLKYVQQIVIGAASWNPLFEIRASTELRDSPVHIFDRAYKPAVGQESGEVSSFFPLIGQDILMLIS